MTENGITETTRKKREGALTEMSIRTDLALEMREMYAGEISGVESNKTDSDGVTVTSVKITSAEGALKIGKPIGNYITIELDNMDFENEDVCDRGAHALSDELKKIITLGEHASVLVVGLGNRRITPDSVGPKTIDKLFVTRHMKEIKDERFEFDFRPVSAVVPGVLGITGIETGEIVTGIADRIKPDLIIAVDALASRKLSRLGTTVQIADTGINPGSGVGNNRKELSEKTLGVPVIAIGIPMVSDAATVAGDVFSVMAEHIRESGGSELYKALSSIGEDERTEVIKEVLTENEMNQVITPNNVDVISEQAAKIIAGGINLALHGDMFL